MKIHFNAALAAERNKNTERNLVDLHSVTKRWKTCANLRAHLSVIKVKASHRKYTFIGLTLPIWTKHMVTCSTSLKRGQLFTVISLPDDCVSSNKRQNKNYIIRSVKQQMSQKGSQTFVCCSWRPKSQRYREIQFFFNRLPDSPSSVPFFSTLKHPEITHFNSFAEKRPIILAAAFTE